MLGLMNSIFLNSDIQYSEEKKILYDKCEIEYFHINGYEGVHTCRSDRRGGGVAIYIKEALKFSKRESFSFEEKDLFECVSVNVHLNDRKTVNVMCMYRTPKTNIDIFDICA